MVRVNLVPNRQKVAEKSGEMWLLALGAIVTAQAIGLFAFHRAKQDDLARQVRTNHELSSQIATTKASIANHAAVGAELEELRRYEELVHKLQGARKNPTNALAEVARILGPHGPTPRDGIVVVADRT